MRLMLATLLSMASVATAAAQSDVRHSGGAEFSSFKTYWLEKREGCQPVISLKIKNTSSGLIGPIGLRMEVVDKDQKSVFAVGLASMPSIDLPPDHTREIAIAADRTITPRDCLGGMHEAALSTIHFAIRLTATVGQDPVSVEIVRDEPMSEERVPTQD